MSEEEQRILQLVIQGGDARCTAMEAIEAARAGKFAQAEVLLERSSRTLARAHSAQTDMLQEELNREQGREVCIPEQKTGKVVAFRQWAQNQ